MPSKNNLSSFKVNSKNTLANLPKQSVQTNSGRKPKPITEKQSELEQIRAKA